MATLYELTGEFLQLYEIATEEGDDQAFLDTLEGLMGELEVKARGYVGVIKQLEMEASNCADQVEFWQAKQKARENACKRLKDAMRDAMIQIGQDEVKAGEYSIKLQNNGGKQPLIIDGDVPDSLTKVTIEPDKDRIRAYLEALAPGDTCDFAHLKPRGKHIKIK